MTTIMDRCAVDEGSTTQGKTSIITYKRNKPNDDVDDNNNNINNNFNDDNDNNFIDNNNHNNDNNNNYFNDHIRNDNSAEKSSASSPKPEVPEMPNSKYFDSLKLKLIWKSDNTRTSSESLAENYKILKRLATGGFGTVFLAVRKQDKRPVAIKIVAGTKLRTMKEEPCREVASKYPNIGYLPLEINLMIHLHPCKGVISLIEAHLSQVDQTYVLVEETFPEPLDMFEYLDDRGRLSEPEARHYFVQIVETMKRMHKRGVYYFDLKDENVLINLRNRQVALVDLGGAQWMKRGDYVQFNGTVNYAPPEWMRYKKFGGMELTSWSLGIILVLMTTGDSPFQGDDHLEYNVTYEVPSHFSKSLKDLINGCLNINPSLRPTVDEILESPWTRGVNMDLPINFKLLMKKKREKHLIINVIKEKILEDNIEHNEIKQSTSSRTSASI